MSAAGRRGLLLVAVVALGGCWISSRSPEFACNEDSDCADLTDARTCDTAIGYCVPLACPAACDSCNLDARTCAIACGNGPAACNAVTCPAGFACDITCTGPNACGTITCGDATSCTVACSGGNQNNNACDSIQCGAGACDVTCTDNACGSVACNGSCGCDVACATGTACDALTGCAAACVEAGRSCSADLAGCATCP